MLESVKLALRITINSFDGEIADLIAACKKDLQVCGVVKVDDTDPLIKRAVILYCKANFGYDANAEKFQKSYEMLKGSLMVAGDYIV